LTGEAIQINKFMKIGIIGIKYLNPNFRHIKAAIKIPNQIANESFKNMLINGRLATPLTKPINDDLNFLGVI
jgi:hypothetical protein